MTLKLAHGWQVMLADLSLILFLTTAAAFDPDPPAEPATAPADASEGEAVTGEAALADTRAEIDPVAVFRPGTGTGLREWLATRTGDPREAVTVLARYRPGERDAAMAQVDALAGEAAASGIEPRILVEPGDEETTLVLVTFGADQRMARQLQSE